MAVSVERIAGQTLHWPNILCGQPCVASLVWPALCGLSCVSQTLYGQNILLAKLYVGQTLCWQNMLAKYIVNQILCQPNIVSA